MQYHNTRGAAAYAVIVAVVALALAGIFFAQRGNDGAGAGGTAAFADAVGRTIVGIEPGAGIMINTEKALRAYGLDEAGWSITESSSAAMMAAFQSAVSKQEPIAATLWEPHALFSVAEIRKLDDPKNIYNDPEATRAFLAQFAPASADAEVVSDVIASVVYDGFERDAPAAHEFLTKFSIPAGTQSDWIFKLTVEEQEPERIAQEYLAANAERVGSWQPAPETPLGKENIVIGIPPWPGATVKSRIVTALLQDMGYETEVKELDIGVVYTSIADRQIDMTVAGWLPSTHGEYWDAKGDALRIAGINVAETWLGIGVPSYVDGSIRSLEDLP